MQRYFLPPDARDGQTARATGADFHHIARVMRMRPGDQVEVVVAGEVWLAAIEQLVQDKECAYLRLNERLLTSRESACTLTLIQGLPKGDKIDLIIRQACEIGAARIFIFRGERSVADISPDKLLTRLTRWRKMAKESCEQAHRDLIADVQYFASAQSACEEFMRNASGQVKLLVPYESQTEALPGLREVLTSAKQATNSRGMTSAIGVVIGPEGGFTEREVERLVAAGGQTVTLGPRILRTETAGIVTAAAVMYEWDELA